MLYSFKRLFTTIRGMSVATWIAAMGATLVMAFASHAWSHPHVFIDADVAVVFDEKGFSGVRLTWFFDEMFSSMILLDFDADGNGRLNSSEVAAIEKGAFANLRNFEYFTHIRIDGVPFKVSQVSRFSATVIDGRLSYRFFVPCTVPAGDAVREVALSVYDKSFYSDILLKKGGISWENHQRYDLTHRVEANSEEAYYGGQIVPEEITLRFTRKK